MLPALAVKFLISTTRSHDGKLPKDMFLSTDEKFETQHQKLCTSMEPSSGKFESKAENVDSAYPPSSPTSIPEICSAADETKRVDEYIQRNSMKLSRVDKKRMFKVINRNSEELMKKHSNLNIMSVSPVISHKYGIEELPCIVIYCSDKGKIPPGEQEFPSQLDKIQIDIREGSCSLFTAAGPNEHNDPLRTGINIGGMHESDDGTLGPFVVEAENKKTVGFLTCQHVFSSPTIGSSVTQPSVRHSKNSVNPERKCGEIRSMCTAEVLYNGKPTSVDAAYVALSNRIPTRFEFPAIPEPMRTKDFHGNLRMGPPLTQLKDDEEGILVYKLGHASGLTEGVFDSMQEMIKLEEDPEPFRNVIQISSDGKFAEHGDSGAGVFTSRKNILSVIGLLLGGSNSQKEYYVIPIGAALQALEPKLEIHQFRNDDTTGSEGSSVDPPSDGATASPSNTDTGPCKTVHHTLSKSVTPFSGKKLPK